MSDRSNMKLKAMPEEVYTTFQYVMNLNLSHNCIRELPMDMIKLVLLEDFNCSYNYLADFPKALYQPNSAFANVKHRVQPHHVIV